MFEVDGVKSNYNVSLKWLECWNIVTSSSSRVSRLTMANFVPT